MEMQACELTGREYAEIRDLAYGYCGIDLRSGKEELVKARLGRKLRELGLKSYQEYCDLVKKDATGESLVGMIDALTTNHTNFFREPQHFRFLREVIRTSRSVPKIWSAACATGEEPYSIAFTLMEECKQGIANGTILATDISTRALARAKDGRYREERFAGLSGVELGPFVERVEGDDGCSYMIRKQVRNLVEFRRLNLMEIPASLGTFGVIFCRNVMIYFDQQTQQTLVNRLADHLEPGGYLFIGHSESLTGIDYPLTYVRPTIYRKGGR